MKLYKTSRKFQLACARENMNYISAIQSTIFCNVTPKFQKVLTGHSYGLRKFKKFQGYITSIILAKPKKSKIFFVTVSTPRRIEQLKFISNVGQSSENLA